MLNMHWQDQHFTLTPPGNGSPWHVLVNTSMPSGRDAFAPADAPEVTDASFIVGSRSIVVLIAGSGSRR